ncbi:MAG: hypothetical protein AAF942_07995 [Pseudomonadota bacterium]
MRLAFGFLLALGLAAFAPVQGVAAPQTLLILAQNDGVTFQCADGRCLAEVSTLCLQFDRASPVRGTPYRILAEGDAAVEMFQGMSLVGESAAGDRVTLPLEAMEVRSHRDHKSVMLSIPQRILAEKGAVVASLRLAKPVVLAPFDAANDDHPQSAHDIRLSLGSQRAVATRSVAEREGLAVAAAVIRDTLNALPRTRAATPRERADAFAQALATRDTLRGGGRSHMKVVGAAHDKCGYLRNGGGVVNGLHGRISQYRSCLNGQHDRLMMDINQRYWRDFEVGS